MFSHSLPETTLPPPLQQKPANPIPLSSLSSTNLLNTPVQSIPSTKKVGKWTPEEDELLRKYVATYSEKQWKKVSEHILGRTPIQCLHRWTKILKPGLVKGPWTPDEDQKLLAWVKQEGPGKWAQASNLIPGRSGKQCRERWFNNLNPDVKKGNWSVIEDELIFKLYQKYGSSWSKIAKYIPGRTENSIKNRFYSTLRKLAAAKNRTGTESGSPGAKEMESVGKDIKGFTGDENVNAENTDPNILYSLLQEIACKDETPEKKQGNDEELNVKQEEGVEGKSQAEEAKKGKEVIERKNIKEKPDTCKVPTRLDQAFNLCGEKVVLARDTNLAQHALQEAAGKVMQVEVQENDPDFERFILCTANSYHKVPINLENNLEVIPDFFEDLDLLQKSILDFCSSNVQNLVSAFKMVSIDTSTPLKSEGSIQKPSPKNLLLGLEQSQTPRINPLQALDRNQGFRRRQSQQLFDLPPESNDIGPLIPISVKIPPLDTKENDNENRIKKTTPISKLDLSENIPIFPKNMQSEINKIKLPGVLEQKNLNIRQGSAEKDKKKDEEMNCLIGSIHDTIGAASAMYSQYLTQIDEAVKGVNKEDPNEAREKLGPLFQQLHGLESWLKNAKTDLARLEGFMGDQQDLSSLVKSDVNAGDENKRRFLDENIGGSEWEQLVKKRKVE